MDAFCGNFTLIDNGEHFDEYMKKLGVALPKRGAAHLSQPTVKISTLADNKYRMVTDSMLKSQTLDFALNEPVIENTLDGRQTKTTLSLEGNKLVQRQQSTKQGEPDSSITREIKGGNMLEYSSEMEAFIGTYTLVNNGEHFDEYMKKLGVGLPKREMAKLTHPTVTISKLPDGRYRMVTSSTITTQTLDFALDTPIDEETLDGRKTKTTFSMQGNKMVQNQKATKQGELDSSITREIQGTNMLTTCTCENVTCVRTYEKKK